MEQNVKLGTITSPGGHSSAFPGQGQADVATRDAQRRGMIESHGGPFFEQTAVLAEVRQHAGIEQLLDDRGKLLPRRQSGDV